MQSWGVHKQSPNGRLFESGKKISETNRRWLGFWLWQGQIESSSVRSDYAHKFPLCSFMNIARISLWIAAYEAHCRRIRSHRVWFYCMKSPSMKSIVWTSHYEPLNSQQNGRLFAQRKDRCVEHSLRTFCRARFVVEPLLDWSESKTATAAFASFEFPVLYICALGVCGSICGGMITILCCTPFDCQI